MAPIPGLEARTQTISALSRPAAMRSIRFWSVDPPPDTQTARRMGGSVMGGSRGVESIERELDHRRDRMHRGGLTRQSGTRIIGNELRGGASID
jgi:hypothetical protein